MACPQPRCQGVVATALLLALATPAAAQVGPRRDEPPPTLAPEPEVKPLDTVEEIVVTGRRRPLPTFQEEYEFHKAEFERLRAMYEPERVERYSPGERKVRMPEALTGTLVGRPTLTEKID